MQDNVVILVSHMIFDVLVEHDMRKDYDRDLIRSEINERTLPLKVLVDVELTSTVGGNFGVCVLPVSEESKIIWSSVSMELERLKADFLNSLQFLN